ncbi:serine/threonine protein kinase [Iningainema tapete]|uniref:Serine/threonine protein kinase n=1 Tax=Iningainema tapete BLCC-T55 TaxID=2748662 RepID=A0A8J6XLQ9_9CYAN|nr:serine/threonine-protein kinase [Iningainema tapete]MBD2777113.1 serine/threonine protein kinase [Iningainema tapete BLCC-T55]
MINEILNKRYQIQQQLGRQTGRRTLLALDLQTSQQVVVKLLYLGQDFNWQDLKLFQREAETLKALNHPAIPSYLDYFDIDTAQDKGFGLVQSYVAAKSLEEHLQAGRTFSEAEVKELAKSLLTILTYLHTQQPPVIHRDIKPSNILLTNRSGNSVGQVYLVDFGSVQTLAAHEGGTITVVGTYGYMPPEQFGGRVTQASDLYSLGATLIYLVTGLHPTELPQQDLRLQFRTIANISAEFADWLEWMTEPSLDQRFVSAQQAIEVLDNPRQRKKETSISKQQLRQPPGSKIRLSKTFESLEIIFPPHGLGIVHLMLISFATPIALGLPFFLFRDHSPSFATFLFLQVPAITFMIVILLRALFKRTRLRINSQNLVEEHDLLGLKWRNYSPISREKISNIQLVKLNYTNNPANFLFLLLFLDHDDTPIYRLKNSDQLSDAEIEWLAKEIGDWL